MNILDKQQNSMEQRTIRKATTPSSQTEQVTNGVPFDPHTSLATRQNAIMRMQQTYGNAAVCRMLAPNRATQATNTRDPAQIDVQPTAPASKPQLKITGFSLLTDSDTGKVAAATDRDKSLGKAGEDEEQDKNTSITNFAPYSSGSVQGVSIQVEVSGGASSIDYPDGPKFTQTIETDSPLNGATSPYVDPHPNDDDKPYYYTDSEHASRPTTFVDRPTRTPPSTGSLSWQATLGLNNVNQTTKTVVGLEYLTYGFSLDAAGTLTSRNPVATGGGNHIATLQSEWSDYNFS